MKWKLGFIRFRELLPICSVLHFGVAGLFIVEREFYFWIRRYTGTPPNQSSKSLTVHRIELYEKNLVDVI